VVSGCSVPVADTVVMTVPRSTFAVLMIGWSFRLRALRTVKKTTAATTTSNMTMPKRCLLRIETSLLADGVIELRE
jgi:hypothetical protein